MGAGLSMTLFLSVKLGARQRWAITWFHDASVVAGLSRAFHLPIRVAFEHLNHRLEIQRVR